MNEYNITEKLMGSSFTLGVVTDDKLFADQMLQAGVAEIKRLELLLSEFVDGSATCAINRLASESPVVVNEECFQLIERAVAISRLTQDDFDITIGSLKKIYQFKNKSFQLPSHSNIKAALQHVGYQKMQLNAAKTSVYFQAKDMKISFAAIGKGYASDRVKKLWMAQGVHSGYVNASGDLNAFGSNANGEPWKIGIANPDNRNHTLLYLPLNHVSIATSGDYEQYFLHHGTRYSHNLNPHTGLPLTGIKSVSVISPSAELSDALATAVYVKGEKKGIEFINQMPHTHCIIINDQNQLFFSKHLNYHSYEMPISKTYSTVSNVSGIPCDLKNKKLTYEVVS